jgi:copper chaperone NosL
VPRVSLPPRDLFLGALALLAISIFLPLWQIHLTAPQYPHGLSLFIYIDTIKGGEASTLQNVNILNHYIGMAPIHIESIPEFRFLKYILLSIVVYGLYIRYSNFNKKHLVFLLVVLSVFGLLCILDFYLWLYDYGHNLDPMASIKIPGMSYQPPMLGEKNLLNFTVFSFPSYGVLTMCLSGLIIVLLIAFGFRKDSRKVDILSIKQRITRRS